MSVLIKGMKMPNGCKECHFQLSTGLGDACALLRKNISATVERGGFHSDCPLIELPPHGRLIDADKLAKEIQTLQKYRFSIEDPEIFVRRGAVTQAIKDEPAIIEAEEGTG